MRYGFTVHIYSPVIVAIVFTEVTSHRCVASAPRCVPSRSTLTPPALHGTCPCGPARLEPEKTRTIPYGSMTKPVDHGSHSHGCILCSPYPMQLLLHSCYHVPRDAAPSFMSFWDFPSMGSYVLQISLPLSRSSRQARQAWGGSHSWARGPYTHLIDKLVHMRGHCLVTRGPVPPLSAKQRGTTSTLRC